MDCLKLSMKMKSAMSRRFWINSTALALMFDTTSCWSFSEPSSSFRSMPTSWIRPASAGGICGDLGVVQRLLRDGLPAESAEGVVEQQVRVALDVVARPHGLVPGDLRGREDRLLLGRVGRDLRQHASTSMLYRRWASIASRTRPDTRSTPSTICRLA
jgi:hypothetical protein